MKTLRNWPMAWLIFLGGMAFGCSAKITADSTPQPPPPPAKSPKVQTLKWITEGDVSDESHNEVFFRQPSAPQIFYFDYQSSGNAWLRWEEISRIGQNCNISQIPYSMKWMELLGKVVVRQWDWNRANDFRVDETKSYRLAISFNAAPTCEVFNLLFRIHQEPIEGLLLGRIPLYLNNTIGLTPSKRAALMFYDMTYTSDKDEVLNFSSFSDQVSTDCEDSYQRSMEWLRWNKQGDIIASGNVSSFSDLEVVANTDHTLRIWLKNAQDCETLSLSFQLRSIN